MNDTKKIVIEREKRMNNEGNKKRQIMKKKDE